MLALIPNCTFVKGYPEFLNALDISVDAVEAHLIQATLFHMLHYLLDDEGNAEPISHQQLLQRDPQHGVTGGRGRSSHCGGYEGRGGKREAVWVLLLGNND